ncbi:MAG: hypothetical protein IKP46_07355 [Bacteroidales bacterium]|nr:hypothetical protein [Bacteroidales bacterium]
MNETFSAGRFFRFFLFDNKQIWSRNTRAVVTFGGLGIILYVVTVLLGLIFAQEWNGPSLWARVFTLAFASLVLVFYQTRTYGYLTEPKAGSAYLMLPASRLEKFISMMVITLIELPLAFFGIYLCVDGLIALIDPTVEGAIITNISNIYSSFNQFVSSNAEAVDLGIGAAGLTFQFWVDTCIYLLYFLLCGICFKKHKIASGLAILIGLSLLITILFGVSIHAGLFNGITRMLQGLSDAPVEKTTSLINWIVNSGFVLNGLTVIGLATGIYFRIKTLKH